MILKTDIANHTLGRLGVKAIISDLDTDNSDQGKVLRRNFSLAWKKVLRKHDWNFARQDQALGLVTGDPTDRSWTYIYTLPSDCLVLRDIACDGNFRNFNQLEDQKERWYEIYSTSGTRIWANVKNAYGRYTVNVPVNLAVPEHFGDAVSAELAMMVGPQIITQNYAAIQSTLLTTARADIATAIADDLGSQPSMLNSPSPFHLARLK